MKHDFFERKREKIKKRELSEGRNVFLLILLISLCGFFAVPFSVVF